MKANHINIPSEEVCRRIISDMGMLDNIVAHSRQVCRVSLFLSDRLGIVGANRELITAAALLHDRIVLLNDRMAYILEKYGITLERQRYIRILREKIRHMEKMFFAGLAFSPDDIGRLIATEG